MARRRARSGPKGSRVCCEAANAVMCSLGEVEGPTEGPAKVGLSTIRGFPDRADSSGAGCQAASAKHRGYIADSDTLLAPAGTKPLQAKPPRRGHRWEGAGYRYRSLARTRAPQTGRGLRAVARKSPLAKGWHQEALLPLGRRVTLLPKNVYRVRRARDLLNTRSQIAHTGCL